MMISVEILMGDDPTLHLVSVPRLLSPACLPKVGG